MKQKNYSTFKCSRCGQIVTIENKMIGLLVIPRLKPRSFKKRNKKKMCKNCVKEYDQTFDVFMAKAQPKGETT